MIANDNELQATLARIAHFHAHLTQLRHVETNPATYRLTASDLLAQVDRLQAEVREYLKTCAAESGTASLA
jgi:hypothetical protein